VQDFLAEFGNRIESWSGPPMGNHTTAFFIYEQGGGYVGIGFIKGHYISTAFDQRPTQQEVEEHFKSDPNFTQYFE
jgi:hypothetical protein